MAMRPRDLILWKKQQGMLSEHPARRVFLPPRETILLRID